MRVLVTGGRGLLGSAVAGALVAAGHEVTVLQRTASGRRDVREVLADITDADAVRAAVRGCDAVVHGAAHVAMVGGWDRFEQVNVGGTAVVVDAVRAEGVPRLVHVSSPSVAHAGHALVGAGAGPADPDAARGHYARSKAMAERIALAANGTGLAVTAIRPHLVWGPGDTQLVGRIAERARTGRLALVDDGSALVDTTYVDNAADAMVRAVERCTDPRVAGHALVVTNGEPRTVAEVIGRIALAMGAQPPTRRVPFPVARAAGRVLEAAWERQGRADVPPITAFVAEQLATAHWFEQRTTRAALDWHPRVSLAEGFARLAEDHRRAAAGMGA